MLADLESLERRRANLEKRAKGQDKEAKAQIVDNTGGLLRSGEIRFAALPELGATAVDGQEATWLRCRLFGGNARTQLPQVTKVEMSRTIEASVSADLAVHAVPEGTVPPVMERIDHAGALPEIGATRINLYIADTLHGEAERVLVKLLREAYSA